MNEIDADTPIAHTVFAEEPGHTDRPFASPLRLPPNGSITMNARSPCAPAYLIALAFLSILLGQMRTAVASCVLPGTGTQILTFRFANPILDPPRDAPVGTVFASSVAIGGVGSIACFPGEYTRRQRALGRNVVGEDAGIHLIGYAGFGYRIVHIPSGKALRNSTHTFVMEEHSSDKPRYHGGGFLLPSMRERRDIHFRSDHYRLELVKTAPVITKRQMWPQELFTVHIDDKEVVRFQMVQSLSLPSRTCTSNIRNNQSVALGRVRIRQFSGINSSPEGHALARFMLVLNCSNYSGQVKLTFTDAISNGNTGNALTLSADSSARGIGVQILFNDQAVRFGPASSLAGNINQYDLFSSSRTEAGAAARSVWFKARYLQTASAVTPGTVRAMATVTFSYQ